MFAKWANLCSKIAAIRTSREGSTGGSRSSNGSGAHIPDEIQTAMWTVASKIMTDWLKNEPKKKQEAEETTAQAALEAAKHEVAAARRQLRTISQEMEAFGKWEPVGWMLLWLFNN